MLLDTHTLWILCLGAQGNGETLLLGEKRDNQIRLYAETEISDYIGVRMMVFSDILVGRLYRIWVPPTRGGFDLSKETFTCYC